MIKRPEILAPAGNPEKLKIAFHYGADAAYIAGRDYNLRAGADNFTIEEIEEAIRYSRDLSKKIYVAINIFPKEDELEGIKLFIEKIALLKPDGIIVSDPGILNMATAAAPDLPLILSTQANLTNSESAGFWFRQGIKRVTLARELSWNEILKIVSLKPSELETEIFVHGAMCISYSGRCLLSNYMTGRDSNRGNCSHPCRWEYLLMEKERPGQYFPALETDRGTFIFNSKDLCLIHRIPDLVGAGIDSFKIEGRMKSAYYTAVTVSVYRQAVDSYISDPGNFTFRDIWTEELSRISHRGYTEGFFSGPPSAEDHNYLESGYRNSYQFSGIVTGYDPESRLASVKQVNKFELGDVIEIFSPGLKTFTQELAIMQDETGRRIDSAPRAQQTVLIKTDRPVSEMDIIRKEV